MNKNGDILNLKHLLSFLLLTIFLQSCSVTIEHENLERSVASTHLDWFSANSLQVQNATCRERLPLTSLEIKKFFEKKYAKIEKNESKITINGLTLINDNSKLIYALKLLLTPSSGAFAPPLNLQAPKDLTKVFNFPKDCKTAFCASEIIFGKEIGPQMLFLLDEYDLNTSPYTFSNAQLFKKNEIDDIILSLELLPKHLQSFSINKKLIRYTEGKMRPNSSANVLANSAMEVFDSWARYNSYMRQYVMFHEYAHNLAISHLTNLDNSMIWLKLGNWNKNAKELLIAKAEITAGHPFVSMYGQANPIEDFAESMSAYRLNPMLLKQVSPEKYEYLKLLVFDGVEYTSNQNCAKKPTSHKYQKDIDQNKFPFTQKEVVKVFEACRNQFFKLAFSNDTYTRFKQCINYESSIIWYKKVEKNMYLLLLRLFLIQDMALVL